MPTKVTDPAILAQLNGQSEAAPVSSPKKVVDPALLQMLNDTSTADAAPPAGMQPGSREYADWALKSALAGKDVPQVSPKPPEYQPTDGDLLATGHWTRGALAPVLRDEQTGELRLAWPQAALDLASAVTLPGDVAAGKVDPMSEEGIGRAALFGMAFAGGNTAAPAKIAAGEVPLAVARSAAPKSGFARPATEAVVRSLMADNAMGQTGVTALRNAGDGAMLADAGPATRGLLDAVIQRSGPGATSARQAVEARASSAGPTVDRALNEALGSPAGVQTSETALRAGTAEARDQAYQAAYAKPIDYSSEAGQAVETLMKRVPRGVIGLANRMMQLEGEQSRQIMAKIASDGTTTFLRMPDVRQIDYITRALNQAAKSGEGQGALGGQTDIGRLFGNLARDLRNQTRTAVPEYDQALRTAADPIRQREALRFGEGLLSPSVARDEARDTISSMTGPELAATRQGLRSYVDEVLANVKTVITDPNTDARQARKALQDLSSAAAREKIRLILDSDATANRLFAELGKATKSLELRADVATNSKTFGRGAVADAIKSYVNEGAVNAALSGEPINAAKSVIQNITGRTPKGKRLIEDQIHEQIATMLTGPQGPDALALLDRLIGQTGNVVNPMGPAMPSALFPVAEGSSKMLDKVQGWLGR